MISRIHMQDQVSNRIEEIMSGSGSRNRNELLQDIVTLIIITVFLAMGLGW